MLTPPSWEAKYKKKLYRSYVVICGISLPFQVAKCFYQLSQMKTNQSIILAPISKPVRTFLNWLSAFHFARFVHTQCKDHLSGFIFSLHKDIFATQKIFLKKMDIFAPFVHDLSVQAHFRLSPFSCTTSTSFKTNPSWEWRFQNIVVTSILSH